MTATALAERLIVDRSALTLGQRVEARRGIDQARGITYTPPTGDRLHQLARLMASGLRHP